MSSPPTTLGQYQIIREIARSNDIVYEAYDPLMNRRVAIKELAVPAGTSAPQQEDRINRFKREAQAAGTLNHANIMTVYSFAEDGDRTFMAMEYLDGCTLRNELDTKGSLPAERAIEIALQILEGLGHAHSKGVIHRDIKPDNIQVLSSGLIKITDFGIARLTFQPNLTMDGQVFGTPSYMSPEQVVGKEIDARSDLFSVGVVLYEMLSGTKPFPGDSVVSITYAIMNKPVDRPQNMVPGIWEVVNRVLDKTPHLRYGTAQDMIDALKDALRKPAAPQQSSPYNMAQPATPPPLVGQPMTQYTPYGTPAQAPPPAVYPYNPYLQQPPPQSQSPYQQPYQQPYQPQFGGPTMQPPGPIPVYYPPPPRAPLMKPETVIFMKRLGVTFLIVGALFGVVFAIIGAIANAAGRYDRERHDAAINNVIVNPDKRYPIDERISTAESNLAQLRSETKIEAAKRSIAALYEERGNSFLAKNDFEHGEADFQKALQYDPKNGALASNLGKLYLSKANSQPDPALRADLYRQSGENWQTAGLSASDASKRPAYMEESAKAYFFYYRDELALGDRATARRALQQAQANAPRGTQTATTIDQEWNSFMNSTG